jgi:hypothetical protein
MNQQSMLSATETLQKRNRRCEEQTMAEFLESRQAAGEMSITAEDPVYRYAERAGIPDEFLEIAWMEFRERHLDNPAKRYRDWRAAFRNAVRDNWYRLWRYTDDQCVLTVQGEQAARAHGKQIPQRPNRSEALYARNRAVAQRLSRHSGFDQINYREGVNEDGSF